jgi:transcriptional regulator with XRE-family HTH domain
MSATVSSAKLGDRLRRLRRERGLTLAELSRRTGLGPSTLSRAEGSRITLTHDKLEKISEGLEIGVAALFAPEAKPFAAIARRTVTRANETRNGATPCADILHKRLEPTIREVRATDLIEAGGLQRLTGEAYLFVIEGEVEVLSDTYAPLRLCCGDSLYFDAAMAHAFVRTGEGECRILCVRSQ